jgi:hypothetical protein
MLPTSQINKLPKINLQPVSPCKRAASKRAKLAGAQESGEYNQGMRELPAKVDSGDILSPDFIWSAGKIARLF